MTLARAEAVRRTQLSEVVVSNEQKQICEICAATAAANYQQARTGLSKAELDLSLTEVRSPVTRALLRRRADAPPRGVSPMHLDCCR
jgi:multidrug resistance efflux pump